MDDGRWRELARRQSALISVRQLNRLGVPRAVVRHKVASERWVQRTEHVVSTTTGELSRLQWMWLGVLHAGNASALGGVTAAEQHGLHNWSRDEVSVLVDDEWAFDPVPGVAFFRTRRPLPDFRGTRVGGLPVCRLEPAVLLFAAYEPSVRTAQGIVAAVVQQQLTTPDQLLAGSSGCARCGDRGCSAGSWATSAVERSRWPKSTYAGCAGGSVFLRRPASDLVAIGTAGAGSPTASGD